MTTPTIPLKELGGIIAAAFAVFFFLDARHAHLEDAAMVDATAYHRGLMSESTRYAQIVKYYSDLKDIRPLNEAEAKRLDLVQREQDRIHKILTAHE